MSFQLFQTLNLGQRKLLLVRIFFFRFILMARSCPSGWTAFNSRCFLYVPRVLNWAQAERNCQSMGGNLASVHSFQELYFLLNFFIYFFYYCNGNGRGRLPPT
uniref:C-type lectin domain-containing protein n=1 Tax=Dicentrarchus labrax TaxID=13489 RepID=A0A8P4PXN6_DICLA